VLIAYVADGQTTTTVADGNGNSFTRVFDAATSFGVHNQVWVLATPSGDVGTRAKITLASGFSFLV
jgi:hypothetical protein